MNGKLKEIIIYYLKGFSFSLGFFSLILLTFSVYAFVEPSSGPGSSYTLDWSSPFLNKVNNTESKVNEIDNKINEINSSIQAIQKVLAMSQTAIIQVGSSNSNSFSLSVADWVSETDFVWANVNVITGWEAYNVYGVYYIYPDCPVGYSTLLELQGMRDHWDHNSRLYYAGRSCVLD